MKMRLVMDVMNTILFHTPSIPVLYSLVLEKFDYTISPANIIRARKEILTAKRPIESKCSCNNAEVTYRKRWSYLSSLILKECGVYSDIDEIAQEIHFKINDENAHVVIYPSFISILEDLQNECHSIGTLSNGYSSTKSWLTSLKVDKYFDFMLVSSEIGHLKPCPFAFRIALKKAHQNDNMLSVFVGGFFMAIPSSGSPSRTAINFSSGAKTRISGISSGVFLFLFFAIIFKMDRLYRFAQSCSSHYCDKFEIN